MEKRSVNIDNVIHTIINCVSGIKEKTNEEIGLLSNEPLSSFMDSLQLVLLINELENTYLFEFPVDDFSKTDTFESLARKVIKYAE